MDIEKVIREYLPTIVHMSLATSDGTRPWVCEVHFAYDEDLNLYYRSLTSRRHSQEIAKNSRVAGNIVVQHALNEPGRGVYFEGVATLLESGEELQKAFECIKERLEEDDDILTDAQKPDGHKFYKISVETYYVFGPFEGRPSQKYTLPWKTIS